MLNNENLSERTIARVYQPELFRRTAARVTRNEGLNFNSATWLRTSPDQTRWYDLIMEIYDKRGQYYKGRLFDALNSPLELGKRTPVLDYFVGRYPELEELYREKLERIPLPESIDQIAERISRRIESAVLTERGEIDFSDIPDGVFERLNHFLSKRNLYARREEDEDMIGVVHTRLILSPGGLTRAQQDIDPAVQQAITPEALDRLLYDVEHPKNPVPASPNVFITTRPETNPDLASDSGDTGNLFEVKREPSPWETYIYKAVDNRDAATIRGVVESRGLLSYVVSMYNLDKLGVLDILFTLARGDLGLDSVHRQYIIQLRDNVLDLALGEGIREGLARNLPDLQDSPPK